MTAIEPDLCGLALVNDNDDSLHCSRYATQHEASFEVDDTHYFFRAGAFDEVLPGVLALLGLIVPE